MRSASSRLVLISLGIFAVALAVQASDLEAWLRYTPLAPETAEQYEHLPSKVVVIGDSPIRR
jgi:hypothetical protein